MYAPTAISEFRVNFREDYRHFTSGSSDAVTRALGELEAIRDGARQRLSEFSAQTLFRWKELEHELENKVCELESRIADSGPTAVEAALARIEELAAAIHELLREHLDCSARALMTSDVRVCSPHDTLEQVARQLWDGDCGALPVLSAAGRLMGMITDRDVCMAAYLRGQPLHACRVQSAMSRQAYSCAPEDSVQRIAAIMSEHRVRRLPVVDGDDRLLGVVTLADLAKHLNTLPLDHPMRDLLVSALAAITDPRPTISRPA
jgi:predicted transcriptional regulator